MSTQRDIFLSSEGDAWFNRNKDHVSAPPDTATDPVLRALSDLAIAGETVVEIGCSTGYRLAGMREGQFRRRIGVDPSQEAIASGKRQFPGIELHVGTSESLEFESGTIDVLIFGFCLYLCSPQDLFRTAAEADRVVKDDGVILIYDFCTKNAYANPYSHRPGVKSHKMFFPAMFLWHPHYTLVSHRLFDHQKQNALPRNEDAAVAVSVMRKSVGDKPA
jgi:ubiquinone/menaquinone biosynthesis C-methylase UbiE